MTRSPPAAFEGNQIGREPVGAHLAVHLGGDADVGQKLSLDIGTNIGVAFDQSGDEFGDAAWAAFVELNSEALDKR